MNPLITLLLDEEIDPQGNHLYPEQRLAIFEDWWQSLSQEQKLELANANPR